MPVREVDFILNHILDNYPKVSDINVSVGRPFQVEVDGELIPVEFSVSIAALTPFQTETFALQLHPVISKNSPGAAISMIATASSSCEVRNACGTGEPGAVLGS